MIYRFRWRDDKQVVTAHIIYRKGNTYCGASGIEFDGFLDIKADSITHAVNLFRENSHIRICESCIKKTFMFNKNINKKTKRSKRKKRLIRDEFLHSYEWRKLRIKAIEKYGNRCQCCGAGPKDGATINVDHIKPRKHYPELALDLDNLQILCHTCNHGKGNWSETDWR